MRARRWLAVFAVAMLAGWLGAIVWLSRPPLQLEVEAAEPIQITDEEGVQMLLGTLSVRNGDSTSVAFERRKTLQVRVGERWVEVAESFYFERLGPDTNLHLMVLLPAHANTCRLTVRYERQVFKARLWPRLPAGVQRLAARSATLRRWLYPPSNPMPTPPQWKEITLEAKMPARRAGAAAENGIMH